MKVILLQNVPKLGQKNDAKEVKTGYWRNFLLPNDLAILATPKLLEQAEKSREEASRQKEAEAGKISEEMKRIKDKILTLEAKADEKGNLFAGINKETVSNELKEQMGLDVSPGFIEMQKPIKKIGSYDVPIGDYVLKIEVSSKQH